MNLSYKILFILLLPIYVTQAMEEENKAGTMKVKGDEQKEAPSGLVQMGELIDQASQTTEVQDPRGTYGRTHSAAALHRTPTVTTVGSTPATSMPASRAQLPGLPNPSSSATRLPGLDPAINASPDLLASVVPFEEGRSLEGDEFKNAIQEANELISACPHLLPISRAEHNEAIKQQTELIAKKMQLLIAMQKGDTEEATKISSPAISSSSTLAALEKRPSSGSSPIKPRTIMKPVPQTYEQLCQEYGLKWVKGLNDKFENLFHNFVFGRYGTIHLLQFFGITDANKAMFNGVPTLTLKGVVAEAIRNELEQKEKTNNWWLNCKLGTFAALTLATNVTILALVATQMGDK